MDNLRDDLYIVLMDYSEYRFKEVNISQVIQELSDVMRRYHMQVPMNLMLMLKVIMMVADIGKSLDPGFNFSSYIEPYMEELSEKEFSGRKVLSRARESARTTIEGIAELPLNLNTVLKRLSTGSLRVEIAEEDLRRVQHIFDRASDRVLVGLITAALVVGSSIVIFASGMSITGPLLFFAYLGYAVAVIIGFIALYSSLR
jgi:ubiquinone biosynthesis protein